MSLNRTLAGWAAFAVVAAAFPALMLDQPYLMRVIAMAMLFAAMSQTWNIVGGLGNQISLGHAAFFGVGCYTSTLLLIRFGISPWIGMLCGLVLSGLIGALLCIPTMRLRGHYFALATLAFGEAMRVVANSWGSLTGGPVGISVPAADNSLAMLQFDSSTPYYYIFLAAFLVVTAVFITISRSKLGYRLRALRTSPEVAEVVGVNTARTKVVASCISAGLIGACGTLYAQFNFFFDPDSAFSLIGISINIALICIIGGLGTAAGPLIGAFLILPAEEVLNSLFTGQTGGGYAQLFYGLLLMIIVLVEPRGIVALSSRFKTALRRSSHPQLSSHGRI